MIIAFLKNRPVIAVPLLMTVLFFLLSPGIIVTIPPGNNFPLFNRQTSYTAAFVHAVIFTLVFSLIKWFMFRT